MGCQYHRQPKLNFLLFLAVFSPCNLPCLHSRNNTSISALLWILTLKCECSCIPWEVVRSMYNKSNPGCVSVLRNPLAWLPAPEGGWGACCVPEADPSCQQLQLPLCTSPCPGASLCSDTCLLFAFPPLELGVVLWEAGME